ETKIRQMEFMSGVQQIGGVINYWAENARKQKEMRAAAERRAEEREAEAEANFRQRMLERDRLHLPVTDYETFSALKEATDKDLVPFVDSEVENDPQLNAEFERVRDSLMYFDITDDGWLREATMDSGSKMMIIENKDEALGHSYALKFDESRQRKGQGYFILMSQELHSIMLKKPPYSGDLISGHRMRDGFYYNIDGYYQLAKGLKKRDIQSKLSQTHKDIVDFGNRTFMGKYAIGINTKTHKFHVLFNDFNTTRLRYEFTWKGINFRQPKGGNAYLFNTEV